MKKDTVMVFWYTTGFLLAMAAVILLAANGII